MASVKKLNLVVDHENISISKFSQVDASATTLVAQVGNIIGKNFICKYYAVKQ